LDAEHRDLKPESLIAAHCSMRKPDPPWSARSRLHNLAEDKVHRVVEICFSFPFIGGELLCHLHQLADRIVRVLPLRIRNGDMLDRQGIYDVNGINDPVRAEAAPLRHYTVYGCYAAQ
jgi:hypothetical protein